MSSDIKLPSELEIMAIPPLAALAILDVSLAMTRAAIHCEHINLDEIDLYCADGASPPTSMLLARDMLDQATALRKTISKYVDAMTEYQDPQCFPNLPF